MRIIRFIIELAIPDNEAPDRLEQIKTTIREAWPAMEIFDRGARPRATRSIRCQKCGLSFVAKRADAKFCTDACRVASHTYRNREGAEQTR